MATLQFPDSPGPNAVYDAPNGVQYVWTGEYWAANDAEDKYDARYVKVTGDNMTGDLTLGGDKIDLNASSGSITNKGQIRTTTNNGEYSIVAFGGSSSYGTYYAECDAAGGILFDGHDGTSRTITILADGSILSLIHI